MNSLQIEYFMALTQYMNFSKAANHLYVSQAAVSKQISILEQELGFSLYHRGYRSLSLTPAGEIMYAFFSKTLSSYETSVEEAMRLAQDESGRINIGLVEGVTYEWLWPKLRAFQTRHKKCTIRIRHDNISHIKDGLRDGKFDLIFTYTGATDDPATIRVREIMNKLCGVCLSKFHPLAENPDLAYTDFSDCVFSIPVESYDTAGVRFTKMLTKQAIGYEPKEVIVVGNISSSIASMHLDHTVSLLHENEEFSKENVLFVPSEYYQPICLLWDVRRKKPQVEELIADF